jgi:hypothetical protein
MLYEYLKNRGALNEAVAQQALPPGPPFALIEPHVLGLVPEPVAREHIVIPISLHGETLTLAAAAAADIKLADKLSFIVNKKIRLIAAPREQIVQAINYYYGQTETESVNSMLQELADEELDVTRAAEELAHSPRGALGGYWAWPSARSLGKSVVEFKKGMNGPAVVSDRRRAGQDTTPPLGGSGMFYHVVEEGQRVLMRKRDGTMEVIVGPRRVWIGRSIFQPMAHYVAHPGEFLLVRFRDGRQEHLAGPADIWFDPRVHQEITRQDALELATKEAVVVYSRRPGAENIVRRVEYGPAQFIPQPGEWLHTFSWHASKGGHLGVQKVPNGLVFQKLWLMPDQMYHDVVDVRTADDAVLTVRLMIFFELVNIERMLDTTHDPIGDFVNAATSDVIDFTGKHDFESFKRNTTRLNELETYTQLAGRAEQSGYRINKVVYRGYGAPAALQQMHDQAIQSRTKLQLDRATEQQAQDLENYRLDCQINRASKRRVEQTAEVDHDLELANRRQEADRRQRDAQQAMLRQQRRLQAEQSLDVKRQQDAQQREHLAALRELSVDLTAYLTQARADKVIELRGASGGNTHFHLDHSRLDGEPAAKGSNG